MEIQLSKIAIIAGNAELSEQVCSHFRSARTYVVLIEAPTVRLEEYGVFESDCIAVANGIKDHHPRALLLLGCSKKVTDALRPNLPPVDILELDVFDKSAISNLPGFRERSLEVATEKPLSRSPGHIVAAESDLPLSIVIAKNLAVSIGAILYLMPRVSHDEVEFRGEQLRTWANEFGTAKDDAKRDLLEFINAQVGPLVTCKPESISFITRGIPYGLHPVYCPTTHFFSYPFLGLSVLNGLAKSLNLARRSPAVVLIDPGVVEQSEIGALRKSFGKAGYLIRNSIGEQATAGDVRYLTEFMPSDFIFYSTHCGEVRGRRITERFPDQLGTLREITYDVVRGLAVSPAPDLIEVQSFFRFVSLDGVDWSDDEGKSRIGAGDAMKAFIALEKRRKGDPKQYSIVSSVESLPIKSSDSLKMHDFNYSPMPRVVGGYMHPVVFNNACSSWRELAMRYGCNGASAYIGTSLDVLDSVAFSVATSFAQAVASGRTIGYALFQAQKKFVRQQGYSQYLMHGHLFTTLRPLKHSDPPPSLVIMTRLLEAREIYEADWGHDKTQERALQSIRAFFNKELQALTQSVHGTQA